MTFSELKLWFYNSLSNQYSERESTNILKILFSHIDSENRNWSVLSLNEAFIIKSKQNLRENYIPRLLQNEPLAYIIEEAEFYDLKFRVNSSVLIPRPETEELVNWVLEDNKQELLNLLDIGTGSGCIPISIAKKRSNWNIKATDISKDALDLAKHNAVNNSVNIDFELQDILKQEIEGQFDIIVSNPPYIGLNEQNKMSTSTVQHEPHLALFTPNNDPLLFYKRIGALSKNALTKTGLIYFELNEFYAEKIKKELEKLNYKVELKKDLQGKIRMAKCSLN